MYAVIAASCALVSYVSGLVAGKCRRWSVEHIETVKRLDAEVSQLQYFGSPKLPVLGTSGLTQPDRYKVATQPERADTYRGEARYCDRLADVMYSVCILSAFGSAVTFVISIMQYLG